STALEAQLEHTDDQGRFAYPAREATVLQHDECDGPRHQHEPDTERYGAHDEDVVHGVGDIRRNLAGVISSNEQRERKEDDGNLRQDSADQHDSRPVASPALGLAK